jgi:hypothetical protein
LRLAPAVAQLNLMSSEASASIRKVNATNSLFPLHSQRAIPRDSQQASVMFALLVILNSIVFEGFESLFPLLQSKT